MRLGFAISTAHKTDIMLLDEWFGAGDAQFLKRARQRLMDRVDGSKIVVLASHNDYLLRKLCNRAIVLDRGRLVFDGGVAEALRLYHSLNRPTDAAVPGGPNVDPVVKKKPERAADKRKQDAEMWRAARQEAWLSTLDERAAAWKKAKEKAWMSSLDARARAWKDAKERAWLQSLDLRAAEWKAAKQRAWLSTVDERARAWAEAKKRALGRDPDAGVAAVGKRQPQKGFSQEAASSPGTSDRAPPPSGGGRPKPVA